MNTLIDKEIEEGLTSPIFARRWSAARRKDFIPTDAQLERGLNDEHPFIRGVFKSRMLEWEQRRQFSTQN